MTDEEIFPRIAAALDGIDRQILARSGSVFYSGRAAFEKPSAIYLLGLNPGGDPDRLAVATIAAHRRAFQSRPARWSAYVDESWEGAAPGSWGMQPRVLHLLRSLRLNPHDVPASNVVFVRSKSEAALRAEKVTLLAACWPVHQEVIEALSVRILVCFGRTAGRWAAERLGASELVDEHWETNARRWRSTVHHAPNGRQVVTLTHPSRADWRNPSADPSDLLRRAMMRL